MLSSIIDAFKVPELRKKILFTLAILALYRFGAYVPVPGIPFHEFATAFQDTGVAMTDGKFLPAFPSVPAEWM